MTSSTSYTLTKGRVGLLISMPHNGQQIPDDIAAVMTNAGKQVADTDWYMDTLYDFAALLGVYTITPKYSRYVVDLNRNTTNENLYPGANSTELCPTTAFDLSPLYLDENTPNEQEIERRIALYWQPYHLAIQQTIAEMKQQFDHVILFEAHSILSHVPRFFSGKLPDFNFGTVDNKSCAKALIEQVETLDFSPYTTVTNGRFKGGYITRAYAQPAENIHTLQLELSQQTYMDEPSDHYNEQKATQVKKKLKTLVECLIKFTEQRG